MQQQATEMLQLEYHRAELKDWSLSLSNDDLREQWKKIKSATIPNQIFISTRLSKDYRLPLAVLMTIQDNYWQIEHIL